MINRPNDSLPARAVGFLKWCYRFVHEDWQHANRDASLPDQGFAREFRHRCTVDFGRFDWNVSQAREMQLTGSLRTASGVLGVPLSLEPKRTLSATLTSLQRTRTKLPTGSSNDRPTDFASPVRCCVTTTMLSHTDLAFLAYLGFNEAETDVRRSILSRFGPQLLRHRLSVMIDVF
jgi:hypothetical protein